MITRFFGKVSIAHTGRARFPARNTAARGWLKVTEILEKSDDRRVEHRLFLNPAQAESGQPKRQRLVAEVEGRMDLDALQAVRHRESDERRQLAAALRRPSG